MDKQKQMMVFGGVGAGVAAIAAGAYFLMSKPAEPTPTPPSSDGPGQMAMGKNTPDAEGNNMGANLTPALGAGGTAQTAAPGAAQATPAGGMPNVPGAKPGAPGAAGSKVVARMVGRPRKDPFYVDWTMPPPPPNVFTEVQPIRLASADIETPPAKPIEVREVPNRRVSGIMSGDGVFAILESNGTSEIVKPGGTTDDGFKVVSITADSVRLQKKEGNIIRTQLVLLSDAPTTGAQTAGFNGGGGGFGGMGGGMPGSMGGRPGGPGGMAPGRPGGGGKGGGGID